MQVNIKYLHPDAKTPTYGSEAAACFDLYAAACGETRDGYCYEFSTGLAFEIPEDHVMLVFSRSGHGFKNGSTLVNSVGVIDSDYRGCVAVKMTEAIPCGVGDRITQAMILPIDRVNFNVVEQLSDTVRGENGFGSTGVK